MLIYPRTYLLLVLPETGQYVARPSTVRTSVESDSESLNLRVLVVLSATPSHILFTI